MFQVPLNLSETRNVLNLLYDNILYEIAVRDSPQGDMVELASWLRNRVVPAALAEVKERESCLAEIEDLMLTSYLAQVENLTSCLARTENCVHVSPSVVIALWPPQYAIFLVGSLVDLVGSLTFAETSKELLRFCWYSEKYKYDSNIEKKQKYRNPIYLKTFL